MFSFLKNKIKDAINKFSSSAKKETKEVSEVDLTLEEKEKLIQEEKEFEKQESDVADESDEILESEDEVNVDDDESDDNESDAEDVVIDDGIVNDKNDTIKSDDALVDRTDNVSVNDGTVDSENDVKTTVVDKSSNLSETLIEENESVDNNDLDLDEIGSESEDDFSKEIEEDLNEDALDDVLVDDSEVKQGDDVQDVVGSSIDEITEDSLDEAIQTNDDVKENLNSDALIHESDNLTDDKISDDLSKDDEVFDDLIEDLDESQTNDANLNLDAELSNDVELDKSVDTPIKNNKIMDVDSDVTDTSDYTSDDNSDDSSEDISNVEGSVDDTSNNLDLSLEDISDKSEEKILSKEEQVVNAETKPKSKPESKGFFSKLFGKKKPIESDVIEDDIVPEEKVIEEKAVKETQKESRFKEIESQNVVDTTKKSKGFFTKLKESVTKFKLTDEAFEEIFWDLELGLLENSVAVEVIEKIKADLKEKLTQENVSRRSIEDIITQTLQNSINEILSVETFDLVERVSSKKPFVISMIGVNGSGKTTTLAKIIKLLQDKGLTCVVAASDTFRAAALEQLETHTNNLGVKLIKHDYNADPAAVAFDAIKHAKAKGIDVVLIDTAGRLQSNTNLMGELKKLIRVNQPDLKIFIGEAITGNDCIEQAMAFNEEVGIDAVILSKADVDEKGGAALSISYVIKKPILYLGVGQEYKDLEPFDKNKIINLLFG